jgi:hypothetical protein
MTLLQRLRTWWNRDALERAEEETHLTERERDAAEEEFEARKDDLEARRDYRAGDVAEFEHDSERPSRP